jgi:hypothetical protein
LGQQRRRFNSERLRAGGRGRFHEVKVFGLRRLKCRKHLKSRLGIRSVGVYWNGEDM